MSKRPSVLGRAILTFSSNRPARRMAGSNRSMRLVAATKTTPWSTVNPSISDSSWFSVCSRSSFVFSPAHSQSVNPPAVSLCYTSTLMLLGACMGRYTPLLKQMREHRASALNADSNSRIDSVTLAALCASAVVL